MIKYYILEIHAQDYICFPQQTLWATFEEALHTALEVAIDEGITIDMFDGTIDPEKGIFFVPSYCEIMPICLSTKEVVTWLGEPYKGGTK